MESILTTAKHFVERRDLSNLQSIWKEMCVSELPEYFDIPTLFQTVYLHACLQGVPEIARWLQDVVFPTLDPIVQIALRQVFPYGRALLQRSQGRIRG